MNHVRALRALRAYRSLNQNKLQNGIRLNARGFVVWEPGPVKFLRPDRWRVEPQPITEPYTYRKHWVWHDHMAPDGKTWSKHFSYSHIRVYYLYFLCVYWWYLMYW